MSVIVLLKRTNTIILLHWANARDRKSTFQPVDLSINDHNVNQPHPDDNWFVCAFSSYIFRQILVCIFFLQGLLFVPNVNPNFPRGKNRHYSPNAEIATAPVYQVPDPPPHLFS
jgi:hypothetical protein